MTEEVVSDYAADAELAQPKKRGRPAKAAAEEAPAEPVNTIVNLEVPDILITKPSAEEPEGDVYLSPQTLREMEAGRKAIGK